MALRVGDLYVLLSARTDGLTTGLKSGAEQVEQFAKRAKRMSNEFAAVGAGISAAIIGIVSKVQSLDPVAHQTFQNFTLASQTLGVQIAHVAAPALEAMGQRLREVANYLAGLSPQTRQHIADWIQIAAAVGTGAFVFGRVMGLLKGFAVLFSGLVSVLSGALSVFSAVAAAVAGIGEGFLALSAAVVAIGAGPIMLVVGGVAAIIALVLVLRKAWSENWGGMQEMMKTFISTISGWWSQFAGFLGTLWGGIVDDVANKVKALATIFFMLQSQMPGANKQMIGFAQQALVGDETHKGAIDAAAATAKSPMAMLQLWSDAKKAAAAGATGLFDDLRKKFDQLLDALGLKSNGKKAPGVADPEMLKMMQAQMAELRAVALSDNQRSIDNVRRQRDFNNIGAPQAAIWGELTKGFASFDDALKQNAAALHQQASLLSQAKLLELRATQLDGEGAHQAAQAALDDAEQLKLAAQSAGDMATKADEAAKAFSELKTETSQQLMGAFKILGESLTSNMGKLGSVINAGVQGFQSGGPWGAVIAVIMQFVTQAKGFTDILNIGNGMFDQALKQMAKGLGDLFNGFKPFLGAIDFITQALNNGLGQTLSVIGNILKAIAPIFMVIGLGMSLLSTFMQPLTQIIGALVDVIGKLISFALSPLVIIFMYLKVAADGIALGFNTAINELEKWIHDTLKIDVGNNQGATDAAQKTFDDDKAAADAFAQDFVNHPFDALNDLINNNADSLNRLNDATNTVTESFLNVPEGIKVAMYAFNATAASASGSTSSSSYSASSAQRARYRALGTTVDLTRFPKKKP